MKYIAITLEQDIERFECYEGLPLEKHLEKVITEKTPIESISPEIFTEKKDGVRPEFDIRTDKWDIAHNAMDAVSQTQILISSGLLNKENTTSTATGKEGVSEQTSTQGTIIAST